MVTKHRIPKSILGNPKMDIYKCPISKIPLYFWSKKSIICKVGTFVPQPNEYFILLDGQVHLATLVLVQTDAER